MGRTEALPLTELQTEFTTLESRHQHTHGLASAPPHEDQTNGSSCSDAQDADHSRDTDLTGDRLDHGGPVSRSDNVSSSLLGSSSLLKFMVAGAGVEPATPDRKSGNLPLVHPAI